VPILGILTCGFMMYFLPLDTWIRLLVWMAIGLLIYFLYSRHHSVLQRTGHTLSDLPLPPEPTYTEPKDR
jgi:APA family basic amino acid/polyamine antiporter